MCTPKRMHCCCSFPRTVTPTRACSGQGAASAVPCTAARLMMAYVQGQAPSSAAAAAAAAKPCHNTSSSTGPCQVLWLPALLQELFFCSTSPPHYMLCLMGSQSCHGKVRMVFGQFCNAVGVQHSWNPLPWAQGTPLSPPDRWSPFQSSWGVWAPTWAGPFQGCKASVAQPGGTDR